MEKYIMVRTDFWRDPVILNIVCDMQAAEASLAIFHCLFFVRGTAKMERMKHGDVLCFNILNRAFAKLTYKQKLKVPLGSFQPAQSYYYK